MTLKDAWFATPGPDTPRQSLLLLLKGFCMGAADIIPGVSGGTIAFITNIYDQLMAAIKSFGLDALVRAARLDVAGALSRVHLRFLTPLLLGVLLALASMARLMHMLLAEHPVQVWALFFGLIAASILVVGRRVPGISVSNVLAGLAGALGSWHLVGMIPVATPETPVFLFFCGALAICAMILPGISGAFILLLLGKYEFMTGALKAPFADGNPLVILIFAAGALVGLLSFSRVLHWLLRHYHGLTVSLLTGVMAGAMRKVWPWKEVLETRLVGAREVVVREQNVLPDVAAQGFWLAVGLMVLGFVLVLLLEYFSGSTAEQ
jgi:putative membrane protein